VIKSDLADIVERRLLGHFIFSFMKISSHLILMMDAVLFFYLRCELAAHYT
jgi:hypothetical protein